MNRKVLISILIGILLVIGVWVALQPHHTPMYQGLNMSSEWDLGTNITSTTTYPTFGAKIKEAGYDKLLQTAGPYTVFVPSEQAYANVTQKTNDYLAQPEHRAAKKALLLFHVVKGNYSLSDIKDGMTLTTLQGEQLRFKVENGTYLINDYAYVTIHDIASKNGIIHVIDNVLIPDSLLSN